MICIREDGLLGLDFLQANRYILSADSGLRLNKKRYNTIVQKVPFRAIRVSCQQTVTLPAYSEMVISGTANSKEAHFQHGLVSPLDGDCSEDFMVGNTLVDPSRKDIGIPVRVMNTTCNDVTIPTGMALGTMSDITDELVMSDISTSKVDEIKSENPKTDDKLPEHLIELYRCSSKDLSSEEKQKLKELLIKHADVFAKSPN